MLSITLALATTLTAQGVFVVDANNGPGANFTSLQVAVNTVANGSVLLVLPGTYSAFSIINKGLTVLGGPGVVVDGSLVVQSTLPSQAVTVFGVGLSSQFQFGASVRVSGANGPVTLDGNGAVATGGSPNGPLLSVTNSPQVHLRNWTLLGSTGGSAAVVGALSSVVFERCHLVGSGLISLELSFGSTTGLEISASRVQLVDTTVTGGNGGTDVIFGNPIQVPGAPAIRIAGGQLRALGLATHPITGGTNPPALGGQRQAAIAGTGTARIDPAIPLLSPPGAGIQVTQIAMPRLLADSAPLGGTITATRSGPAGSLCVMALSLRGTVSFLPTIPDPVWIDAASLVGEASGIVPASGNFTVQKAVPNQTSLRGFGFVWQAADFNSAGQLSFSNPSSSFVR
jgi:hypothetical protein